MGINLINLSGKSLSCGSSSSMIFSGEGDETYSKTPQAPEPNPKHFRVISAEEINGWTIAYVQYPACTTYNGMKLLVYACNKETLLKQKILDPHFIDNNNGFVYPVARFEPTKRGQKLAAITCIGKEGYYR